MGRIELLPLLLVGGLAAFVAAQSLRSEPSPDHRSGAADGELTAEAASLPTVIAPGMPRRRSHDDMPPGDSARSREARRSALDATAADTYLPRLLADGERVLTRWRPEAPVYVWVAPTSSLKGWHPRMVAAAREAFDHWRSVVPVEFRFVADSQDAQVVVSWRDSFNSDSPVGGLVGHARRHYTADGWITAAEVALAVHSVDGTPLPPSLIRAAALHEVGHVLGLPHSDAPDDMMAPSHAGIITRLSLRDERTARALYGMEAGAVE